MSQSRQSATSRDDSEDPPSKPADLRAVREWQGVEDAGAARVSGEPFFIGTHWVQVEDCIIHVRLIGPYLPEHASQILRMADRLFDQYGETFLLADTSRSGPPPPETRRLVATWAYRGPYKAALYGASPVVRVMVRLMNGAQTLLRRVQPIETMVFETAAEARAWISEQRHALQSG